MPVMASAGQQPESLNIQALVDAIPALIHTARPDGYLDYFNRPWLEYLGATLEQVSGWNWRAFIHPEDVDGIVARWLACLASGEVFEHETRVRRADGQYRWMFHHKVPMRDERGDIVKWYGTSLDIEERKRAEEQLRRNTEELQRSEFYLAEGQRLGHTGSFGWKPDTGEFVWSDETFRIFEYDCSVKPTIDSVVQRVHPDDRADVKEVISRAFVGASAFEHAHRLLLPDQRVKHIHVLAHELPDASGKREFVGVVTDISERKRAKEAEDQLRAAISERMRLATLRAEIAVTLASKDTLRGILDRCAGIMVRHLDAAFARIWTLKSGGTELELEASAGIYTRLDGRFSRIPIGEVKIGRIAKHVKAHLTNDVQNDPHISDHNWARAEKIQSFAGYPLIVEERVVGVMAVFSRHALAESTLELLASIADAIAQGIERKRTEEQLKRSEFYLAEGQRLGHTGSWALNPSGFFEYWSQELFQIYGLDPQKAAPTLEQYLATIHPQDRDSMAETVKRMCEEGCGCDAKKRIIRPDGAVRYVRCVGVPVLDKGVLKMFLGTAMDVTDQEQMTQELQRREAYLEEAQRLSHTGSWAWSPDVDVRYWSEECYRVLSFDPRDGLPQIEELIRRIHPDDQPSLIELIQTAVRDKAEFEADYRIVHPDGAIRDIHAVGHPVLSTSGHLVEFVGTVMDVTERKRAEEERRRSEMELRQMLDLAPQHVVVFGPNRERLYANRVMLDYLGFSLEGWRQRFDRDEFVHPDDRGRVNGHFDRALFSGTGFELELRLRKGDGSYRWFLTRCNPVRDDKGQLTRWYVACTDIEDRKQAEQRLQQENVALREEIAQGSMFEEIVGTSPALKSVLSRISKVAPSDSTVLITGETGTGKELVARAIHRRSNRSSRAFVSVNCAAVPRDLIASELFGHEKGAFTGATQQRLGRFELASGGTIFLDEVGELPAETQIALLRVLQEHEFERVGGTRRIRADVRVIAATNRDLQAGIRAGSFRSDLFYRLNVFPLGVPPLRERKEDVPLLVGYFVDRYARRAGKTIRTVEKRTMDLLLAYSWPGNIRELQNIIERSVILCETSSFSVDESWLSPQDLETKTSGQLELSDRLAAQEKEMIEAALRECQGRVSGSLGAAVKLGLPRSTLESKIRVLEINKNRFKP